MSTAILEARGVSKRFVRKLDLAMKVARRLGSTLSEETVHAVDTVDLTVNEGEVVGLVGESGCGKSTLGRVVAGLLPASDGEIVWRGRPTNAMAEDERRRNRLAVQMIFQDPFSSLNPRKRVLDIVGEAPVVHRLVPRGAMKDYVGELLERVGLEPGYAQRYPHQFSGGQRQRVGIARALAVRPQFLVCDEAVSALDVSIQAQIINLFMRLREDLGLTYLFISHDLGLIHHIADRVLVMYLGRIVESGSATDLFQSPSHPYTQALLRELPKLVPAKRTYVPIRGEIPSPIDPPAGCHFHPRCPHAFERCRTEAPTLRPIADGRLSACHLNDAA